MGDVKQAAAHICVGLGYMNDEQFQMTLSQIESNLFKEAGSKELEELLDQIEDQIEIARAMCQEQMRNVIAMNECDLTEADQLQIKDETEELMHVGGKKCKGKF